jgi:ABC-2 type transport system ATP-binding protein
MIEVKNIRKTFKTQQVLKGVNLLVETGKVQALLGANGAGKSTLIYIISGLLEKDEGEVWIEGELINMEDYAYRARVGYVFDKPIYMPKFSAKDHLEFVAEMYGIPKAEYDIRIQELLEYFELPTDTKKQIDSYSKGMKNKVSLASALLHNPKYLIVDEPFDGMDFLSVQKCCSLFRTLAGRGTTILITSHQFDVIAEVGDNFALLKNGEVLFNLPMVELEKQATDKGSVKHYLEDLMQQGEGEVRKDLSWLK